jgi:hypothetical protein
MRNYTVNFVWTHKKLRAGKVAYEYARNVDRCLEEDTLQMTLYDSEYPYAKDINKN